MAVRVVFFLAVSLGLGMSFNANSPNGIPLARKSPPLPTADASGRNDAVTQPVVTVPRISNETRSVTLVLSGNSTRVQEKDH
jgi:hypothetical protein